MFEEFFRHCKLKAVEKPSKKRISRNIASVMSLVDPEGVILKKRKVRIKPLIVAAVAASVVTLLAVNAAGGGNLVKFFVGGKQSEGEYRDYIDHDGFRHLVFNAAIPIDLDDYAIIIDVDATYDNALRVITDDNDPEFMDKLRSYAHTEDREGNDFGLTRESEVCAWSIREILDDGTRHVSYGFLGEEFMHSGAAEGMKSGGSISECDNEDNTKTITISFYYYVGKVGTEFEGYYRDYVDHDDGFRHFSFEAEVPIDFENYAIIVDVDAKPEEAIRVYTDETDPEFMNKVRRLCLASDECSRMDSKMWNKIYEWNGRDYKKEFRKTLMNLDRAFAEAAAAGVVDTSDRVASPEPADFGIVLKDSEELMWDLSEPYTDSRGLDWNFGTGGAFTGKFMHTDTAMSKPSSGGIGVKDYDYENNTKTLVISYIYYVGNGDQPEEIGDDQDDYQDLVDDRGCRRISLKTTIPLSEEYVAVIFDADAPSENAARVVTEDSDPEFIAKLRKYHTAREKAFEDLIALYERIYEGTDRDRMIGGRSLRDKVIKEAEESGRLDPSEFPEMPRPEDFGIVLKDNEFCEYRYNDYSNGVYNGGWRGSIGGRFIFCGAAEKDYVRWGSYGNVAGDPDNGRIDLENETITLSFGVYYYVGDE